MRVITNMGNLHVSLGFLEVLIVDLGADTWQMDRQMGAVHNEAF